MENKETLQASALISLDQEKSKVQLVWLKLFSQLGQAAEFVDFMNLPVFIIIIIIIVIIIDNIVITRQKKTNYHFSPQNAVTADISYFSAPFCINRK